MLNILPLMLAQGRRCDMRVFREIQRTVEEEPPGKRHTVAINPVDDQSEMSRMINLCLDTIETRGNTAVRIRAFFTGVYVITCNFDQCSGAEWPPQLRLKIEINIYTLVTFAAVRSRYCKFRGDSTDDDFEKHRDILFGSTVLNVDRIS